jgi:hypothetical protein
MIMHFSRQKRFEESKCLAQLKRAQHGVHADGWIHTTKLALFMALSFIRFANESSPSSRR